MLRLTIIFILLAGSSLLKAQIDYRGFDNWSWQKEDSTEYYLYTPSGMKEKERYPIALFMHGCCGEDNQATLRNAVDPPARMWHSFGANSQIIPTYIIAPKTTRGWSRHFKNLKKVIDDLVTHHNGDPQRIYVCGFSMGGEGTFRIIQEYPGFFAAAIPMGMDFHGDAELVKDIPIWTHQGKTDYWARNLSKQVVEIRSKNGYPYDSAYTHETGINPRYSNFAGVDHGVQWIAASTQDLVGWAYSKVNDGNKYPVVFFESPGHKETVQNNRLVSVAINAHDPDGSIAKINVYHNGKLVKALSEPPYVTSIALVNGDNLVEAEAFDDKGKTSKAVTIIKVNITPEFITAKIPIVKAGALYHQTIGARGNGELRFSTEDNTPEGVSLYPDGTLKGIPVTLGTYRFNVTVTDEDEESATKEYSITVQKKDSKEILVKDIKTSNGKLYRLSKLQLGESPFFDSKDSILTTALQEINFSEIGSFRNYTLIQTDIHDANETGGGFLSFETDREATVYVCYEKFETLLQSTIPDWLKEYKKEGSEIVAQYRYFDVYSRKFPKGRITLPGADAKGNGVGSNYFVLVK